MTGAECRMKIKYEEGVYTHRTKRCTIETTLKYKMLLQIYSIKSYCIRKFHCFRKLSDSKCVLYAYKENTEF